MVFFLKSVDFGGLWILANFILKSRFISLLVFCKDVYLTYIYILQLEYYIIRNLTCQEKRLRTEGINWWDKLVEPQYLTEHRMGN